MGEYAVTWTGIDSDNSEQFWNRDRWELALEVISRHEGEKVHDVNSPIYTELSERDSDPTWAKVRDKDGSFDGAFRSYTRPWTETGVVDLSPDVSGGEKKFHLTEKGRQVAHNDAGYADALIPVFREHEEDSERPFRIVCNAFLQTGRTLSLEEVFSWIMQGYRPGIDNLDSVLETALSNDITSYTKRSLRRLLLGLVESGVLEKTNAGYEAGDRCKLFRIAAGDMVRDARECFTEAGYMVSEDLVRRYATSLMTKPFVILTGLSGSGKTKLAQLFSKWIAHDPDKQTELVAVEADWTGKEDILGYRDALRPGRFVEGAALDLITEAHKNHRSDTEPSRPYFLILDEMNLAHVERYFAFFLSALESDEQIRLYDDDMQYEEDGEDEDKSPEVPQVIERLPPNLFITGTVNVDETTYTFSPKVLDRANSIEFRVSWEELDAYLQAPADIHMGFVEGKGRDFSDAFTAASNEEANLTDDARNFVRNELRLFFDVFEGYGTGLAYRTAGEIARFCAMYPNFFPSSEDEVEESPTREQLRKAMDAQVYQKLLPKLNGSRSELEPVLCALSVICGDPLEPEEKEEYRDENRESLPEKAREAAKLQGRELHPLERESGLPKHLNGSSLEEGFDAFYPESYKKITRMLGRLEQEGFTSFAEA